VSSGVSRLIDGHLARAASRLAALLLPHILPVFSVVAPCHPGAALRDLTLAQPRRATRFTALPVAALFWLAGPAAIHAQDPSAPAAQPAAPVREVRVTGTRELSDEVVRRAARVETGEPFTETVEHVAAAVEKQYRDEDYTFARATVSFEPASGVLTIAVDEGVIEGVEFQGIDEQLARKFAADFALRAGDVFNRSRATRALDALLQQTRGAVRSGRLNGNGSTFTSGRDARRRRGSFDIVDRDNRRVLLVGLREPAGRFKMVPDLGEREDWFSAVDGFVPSVGFGAAVFDHDRFNHAYVAGHLSYKLAAERVGYALGFERPVLGATRLYLGGELHDLTASDDQWQVSSTEASLAAVAPRRSYRDYYRRRGVQIGGALRVHPQVEFLFAWRGERQEPLAIMSDFSVWNGDETFRPNRAARDGRMNAVVLGASVDGRGFDRESLEATYRRHQLDTPFGERLNGPAEGRDRSAMWRIDWTSEISTPETLHSDFDFRRHLLSGRARLALSPHQDLGVRVIGGWSGGVLPPQRQFAIGGIGSVHGYDFKEAGGDSMALVNLEYSLGWRSGVKLFAFYDKGRVGLQRGIAGRETPWLTGVGWGVGAGDFRIDLGYKVDAVPSSLQVLLRFGRTF